MGWRNLRTGAGSQMSEEGLYVASIVPFSDSGEINDDEVRKLIERGLEEGASGFFVAGSSGECFSSRPTERMHLFELFSEYKSRCVLFAHVGACSTDEAVRYAKCAVELGFQRVAATPPLYFGYSTLEVAGYYDAIASVAGRGAYYYNIPMNTHRKLDLNDRATRAMLASGSIAGIKHTNLDVYEMERIRSINPRLKCFGGFENEMVAFLAMGCDGFIGSTFNFMLPHYLRIYDAFKSGDLHAARELQAKANNVMETIMAEGLFPSIKHIMNAAGESVGKMRPPFRELGPEACVRVDAAVAKDVIA